MWRPAPCSNPTPGRCVCQFLEAPRLRLRGLCTATNVDTEYVFKYSNGSVVYRGRTGSEIRFTTTLGQSGWSLDMNLGRTSGYTSAEGTSYALGNHSWSIAHDASQCQGGEGRLKLTGCRDGEFTCTNGDCVRMEERCDQVTAV